MPAAQDIKKMTFSEVAQRSAQLVTPTDADGFTVVSSKATKKRDKAAQKAAEGAAAKSAARKTGLTKAPTHSAETELEFS